MKLNVGSGPHPCPGWVNVDPYAEHADLRASIYALPLPSESVARVYLGHVLEHLPWDELPRALLEVGRVLRPGGQVMVVGPCLERAVATGQPTWLLEQIIARPPDPADPGAAHLWTPTELLTVLALELGGFTATPVPVGTVTRPAWPNTVTDPWQTAVRGAIRTTPYAAPTAASAVRIASV